MDFSVRIFLKQKPSQTNKQNYLQTHKTPSCDLEKYRNHQSRYNNLDFQSCADGMASVLNMQHHWFARVQ